MALRIQSSRLSPADCQIVKRALGRIWHIGLSPHILRAIGIRKSCAPNFAHPGEGGRQEILRACQFVVPAKAQGFPGKSWDDEGREIAGPIFVLAGLGPWASAHGLRSVGIHALE